MKQKKINVLIAEDNREFCSILNDFLSWQEDITVVGTCGDGLDALKLIKEKKPDLVILDVIMPHLDGLGVLEKLSILDLNQRPRILVLSAVGQDKITQRAISLGADYYIVKPFHMDMLLSRIRQLFDSNIPEDETKGVSSMVENKNDVFINKDSKDLENQITDVIHKLGIPAHIKGYKFLREAIHVVVNDIDILSSVTKDLYPSIANKFNTTASSVEAAIRHAILISWSRGQTEAINKIFGVSRMESKSNPTNCEFIARIADMLRLNTGIS